MSSDPQVRRIGSEVVFHGRAFDVVREQIELPSGLRQDLALVVHPGAVGIVPVLDDGRIVLVRQYRHAIGRWLVEIPAGRLERGEPPELAARRELEEETGYRTARLESLGCFYPAPGFCSERMHLFVARELSSAGAERAAHDADEELDVVALRYEEALAAVQEDAKSFIGLLKLAQNAS